MPDAPRGLLNRIRQCGAINTGQRMGVLFNHLAPQGFGILMAIGIEQRIVEVEQNGFWVRDQLAYFIVGITKSDPDLTPVGQREVTVLIFV